MFLSGMMRRMYLEAASLEDSRHIRVDPIESSIVTCWLNATKQSAFVTIYAGSVFAISGFSIGI